MRKTLPLMLGLAFAVTSPLPTHAGAQQAWSGLTQEMQINLAVQAAPASMRDGATVQGYAADGSFRTIRNGTNDLICMAPNPTAERFEVSCHYAGLEPFFARGRALLEEGVTGQERAVTRWREYEAGVLPIPHGSVNYILTGSGFDPATAEVRDSYVRWTIYVPGATTDVTGITTDASAGGPWLMFPGTPGAHIMITPPRG